MGAWSTESIYHECLLHKSKCLEIQKAKQGGYLQHKKNTKFAIFSPLPEHNVQANKRHLDLTKQVEPIHFII